MRVATDGNHALSSWPKQPSDLVLTDIEMPNMDGFALTEAIRAHPTLAEYPGADPQFPLQRGRPATRPRRRRRRLHHQERLRRSQPAGRCQPSARNQRMSPSERWPHRSRAGGGGSSAQLSQLMRGAASRRRHRRRRTAEHRRRSDRSRGPASSRRRHPRPAPGRRPEPARHRADHGVTLRRRSWSCPPESTTGTPPSAVEALRRRRTGSATSASRSGPRTWRRTASHWYAKSARSR